MACYLTGMAALDSLIELDEQERAAFQTSIDHVKELVAVAMKSQ